MQTKALVTSRKRKEVAGSSDLSLKHITIAEIDSVEDKIDKIWGMFETQLQRNVELMSYINKQHEMMQKIMTSPYAQVILGETPPSQNPVEIAKPKKEVEIAPMPLDKLKRLAQNYRQIQFGSSPRIDGIHNIINILYTMYSLGEAVQPEQIFIHTGVAVSSCYRIMPKLRLACFITLGSRGAYELTNIAKDFLEERLTTYEEYRKRTLSPPYSAEHLFERLKNAETIARRNILFK